MTSTNLYQRLQELTRPDPVLVGTIAGINATLGTAIVDMTGGGQRTVRNPLAVASGARVYVQGDAITGSAPALDYVEILI